MDRSKSLLALQESTKLLEQALRKVREAHEALGEGPEATPLRPRVVAVDPGHGGKDPGAVSGGQEEKKLALELATILSSKLSEKGHLPFMTRTDDTFVEIDERAKMANAKGADIFVSIHLNASTSAISSGPWVLHARPSAKGKELASYVCKKLGNKCKVFPDESDAVSGRKLGVLRGTNMVAVLVECGFITNSVERSNLSEKSYQEVIAEQIAEGIESYIKEKMA